MPPLITILSSVLLASYYCYAMPQSPIMGMGTPSTVDSASAAAAAAAAASSSIDYGGNNNCPPPPCPTPSPPYIPPCPPPLNPPPCPPPFHPPPCPPPFHPPPCPPPFHPPPCPPDNPPPPCPPDNPPPPYPPDNPPPPCPPQNPPPCPPQNPPPFNPCPPSPFPPPPCPPSPYPSPPCPTPPHSSPCPPDSSGSSSASAAASAAAGASSTGSGVSASASASASASTSVQVPNLQQICSYPTDVQQCSQIYSMRYEHTSFRKLHDKAFYIYHASRTQEQITFDSAPCFDFSCSQSCQTIMVKFMIESTTSISKIIWGSDASGNLACVKTSVKVISEEYAIFQDTFSEAQKVIAGSTTAVVSTQTEQLQQFVSCTPYAVLYSDYEHILAMKRCGADQASYIAVCETLYYNQEQIQTNAMQAIQAIMSFHQIDVNSCLTLTQRFSLDISSISITSASFEMMKTEDGTTISGNRIERHEGSSVMSGETSVSRTPHGDVSMTSKTSTNISAGTPSCSPTCPPSSSSTGASASASASAAAEASS